MKKSIVIAGLSALILVGCATTYSSIELEKMAKDAVSRSFLERGIAKKERINQDAINDACSRAEYSNSP